MVAGDALVQAENPDADRHGVEASDQNERQARRAPAPIERGQVPLEKEGKGRQREGIGRQHVMVGVHLQGHVCQRVDQARTRQGIEERHEGIALGHDDVDPVGDQQRQEDRDQRIGEAEVDDGLQQDDEGVRVALAVAVGAHVPKDHEIVRDGEGGRAHHQAQVKRPIRPLLGPAHPGQ
ncbi:hypothetical protein D3C86_1296000 [compost metagenome]